MARPTTARPWIDTDEFTRGAQRIQGVVPLADLSRMADLLADTDGALVWRLAGERTRRADGGSDAHLALGLQASVRMRCVRCLEPIEIRLAEERHYRLVVSEGVAEREDPQSEDVDLLVASSRFDVLELVEDEAIMALPLAPRHADCQPPAGAGAGRGGRADSGDAATAEEGEKPHPFAALAQWRKGGGQGDRDD